MAKGFSIANINKGLGEVQTVKTQADSSGTTMIEIKYIAPSKNNPYSDNDSEDNIKALADSISSQGLIHPLLLRKKGNSEYEILSGERRYKALCLLGWKKIPAQVRENLTDNEAQLLLHEANLETREYSSAEKLKFYEEQYELLVRMKSNGEFKGAIQEKLAQLLNVSDRQVRTYKTICENSTSEERKAISEGNISLAEAYKSAANTKSGKAANGENKKVSNVETGSTSGLGISKIKDSDMKQAIKSRFGYGYRKNDIILYYCLNVPTKSDSVAFLKKEYSYSGGSLDMGNGKSGFLDFNSKGAELSIRNLGRITYTYAQIDDMLREMIKEHEFVTVTEQKHILSAYFSKLQMAEIDEAGEKK